METKFGRSAALGTVFALLSHAAVAQTADVVMNLGVDNAATVYLSQDAGQQGQLLGSVANWDPATNIQQALFPGVTNYIHIFADNTGAPSVANPGAFLGELTLVENGTTPTYTFANGTGSLLTSNAADGWLVGTALPVASAPVFLFDHGDGPWAGQPIANISPDADWIWLDAIGDNQTASVIFTAAIIPTVADIDIYDATESTDDPVIAGSGADNLGFSFTARNNGPNAASGVVFKAALSATIDAIDILCVTLPAGGVPVATGDASVDITWPAMTMAVDEEVDFSFTCTAGATATHGNVFSTALSVEAVDQVDDDATNDSATLDATINREATINVTKTWGDTGSGEVDVMLTCNDVVVDSATTSGLAASFTLNDFDDVTNCFVTEVIPAGFAPTYSGCSAEPVTSGMTYECGISNAVSNATFMVTKEYSDDSTDPVTVTLTCNGGLPLQQSFEISDGNPVNFVITNFIEGEVDCEVTEEGAEGGYTPSFDNGTVVSELSCEYTDVTSGAHTCTIFNAADIATYTVSADWIIPELANEEDNYNVEITVTCDSDILTVNGSVVAPSMEYVGTLADGASVVLGVNTLDGTTGCSTVQEVTQSGVETEASAACTDAVLPAGGSAECVFTNTVFYEGIPTLSQYGLALMALLMLGVGFVGFRRFV